jgi:ADP-ribose pyrophosphatase
MTRPPVDDNLDWEETSREQVLACPVFTAFRSERRAGHGKAGERTQSGTFYILDARDWVTVVPVVKTRQGVDAFLMVRQYRHGIERVTLEFPAGIAEPGESP